MVDKHNIHCIEAWFHLLDCYYRLVQQVYHRMGNDDTLDTDMVLRVCRKAFRVATPEVLNSDQGSQFTSNEYKQLLKSNGVRQSMDGKSRWADNIMIERWFRTIKYEEIYLTQYTNIKEARKAIRQYINTYNF